MREKAIAMERKLEEERLLKYHGNIAGTEIMRTETDSLIREQEEEEKLQFRPTLDVTRDIRE